jgi:hypothetical protein
MTRDTLNEPAFEQACCDERFDAAQMRDVLGTMSSHPAHAAFRMFVWALVAVAPLMAGLLLLAAWFQDDSSDPVRFLVNHGRAITIYGLSAAGFALGFGLTAFAGTVAARSRMLVADENVDKAPVVIVLVLLFVLGIAVWAVPLAISASSQTRLLVAWLGLLPLVLLMSLAVFLPHEDSAGRLVSRPLRLWALILPAAVVSLVVATRLKAASDWLEQFQVIRVPLQLFIDAAGTSGLAPDVIDAMKSWFVTGIVAVAAIPLMGVALLAVSVVGRGLAIIVDGQEQGGPGGGKPWLDDLGASLGIERWSDGSSLFGADRGFLTADPCAAFFAEGTVTLDQAAAFNRIVTLAEKTLSAPAVTPGKPSLIADFLLEGAAGSGRTATLIATLMHGALVHGDTAFVLVADEVSRDNLISRVKSAAGSLHVGGFIHAGALTPAAVSEWAGAKARAARNESDGQQDSRSAAKSRGFRQGTEIPPRILVGTLGDLEESLFGSAHHFSAVEQMVSLVSTVAIDDLDRFGVPDRLHLPYVLAKLRLIRAGDGQSLRTILTVEPIADAARDLVARQLLRTVSLEKHHAILRRLPLPKGASLSFSKLTLPERHAGSVAEYLVTCTRECLLRGLNVAVVAPGLTKTELAEVTARCRGQALPEAADRVCVSAGLDALPTLGSPDHVLVATSACSVVGRNDVVAAVVAWRCGDSSAAVVILGADDPAADAPLPEHALFVLPGKESESLFARHFASAARFLPRLHPVPRSFFSAMGLPSTGKLPAMPADYRRSSDDTVALSDRIILLDPLDSQVDALSTDPVRWPWCALAGFGDGRPPVPLPVAVRAAVPVAMGIQADLSGSSVTLLERRAAGVSEGGFQDMRTAIWRASDGTEIARDDLAYMHSFHLDSEQGLFIPVRVHASATGSVVLDARAVPSVSSLGMPVMPAFELRGLSVPSGIELTHLLQAAPLAHRVSILGLVPRPRDASERAGIGQPQAAALRLLGLYDKVGRLRAWELDAIYEAAKFFVLFDADDAVQSIDLLRDQLLLDWGRERPNTHVNFPELGAAITAAMRRQAPGLERLVRCAGFRILRDEAKPVDGLVFIEPRSTESSGFAVMEPIVYDLKVMAEFFGYAADVLDQASGTDSPAAAIYARAGGVINPVVMNGRLTVNDDFMASASALLRGIAADASRQS